MTSTSRCAGKCNFCSSNRHQSSVSAVHSCRYFDTAAIDHEGEVLSDRPTSEMRQRNVEVHRYSLWKVLMWNVLLKFWSWYVRSWLHSSNPLRLLKQENCTKNQSGWLIVSQRSTFTFLNFLRVITWETINLLYERLSLTLVHCKYWTKCVTSQGDWQESQQRLVQTFIKLFFLQVSDQLL